jgi:PAS domain S-box-containing protein
VLPPDVLHQVLEWAPDAIVVVDTSGRIVFANSSAHGLFGYAAGSLAAQDLESLLPTRFRARHVAHRERYAQEGRDRPMGADLDLSALRHDGTEIPVEISLSRIHNDTGPLMVPFTSELPSQSVYLSMNIPHAAKLAVVVTPLGGLMFTLIWTLPFSANSDCSLPFTSPRTSRV